MTNTNQKQDGIEERAKQFIDVVYERDGIGISDADELINYVQAETATLSAENNRLREMLREVCEAGEYILPAIKMQHGIYIRGKLTLEGALAKAKALTPKP